MNFLDNIIKIMLIVIMFFGVSFLRQIMKKISYDIQFKENNKKIGTLEECNKLVDEFITNEFNNYTILKWNYREMEIMSEAMENEMMNDMITIIQNRMSNNILSRLLCFYNREAVPDVIAEKILILVTAYRININTRETYQEHEIKVQKMIKNNRKMA